MHLLTYDIKAIDHKFLWFRDIINHLDVGRTLEEFVNYSPAARDLRIRLVFYQHNAWFISLKTIETCGLLLKQIVSRTSNKKRLFYGTAHVGNSNRKGAVKK